MDLSQPRRTCPQCGQELPPGAACAQCGRDEANPFISPAAAREPKPREVDSELWFALVVVVAVCVAIGFALPGLGVILGMVFVPAVVRTAAVMRRRAEVAAAKNSGSQIASTVFASAGITIAVWIASAVAFGVVCTPVGLVAFSIRSDVGAVLAFGLGGLAGLAVFFWFMKKLWPRSAKDDDGTA